MNTTELNLLDPDQEPTDADIEALRRGFEETLRLRKANADKRMERRMSEALAFAHRSDEPEDTVYQALR